MRVRPSYHWSMGTDISIDKSRGLYARVQRLHRRPRTWLNCAPPWESRRLGTGIHPRHVMLSL
jgi:hypothetical protein